ETAWDGQRSQECRRALRAFNSCHAQPSHLRSCRGLTLLSSLHLQSDGQWCGGLRQTMQAYCVACSVQHGDWDDAVQKLARERLTGLMEVC
ncbi:unnamed protein product, partial [Scytosiphon promiscuus]